MKFSDLKTLLQAMTRQQANDLADRADVPHSTVAKIRKGHTKQPRVTTVESLLRALSQKTKSSRNAMKNKTAI